MDPRSLGRMTGALPLISHSMTLRTLRSPAREILDLDQFERDLEELAQLERLAPAGYERVADLAVWAPTDYERIAVPRRRLAGIREKTRIVLQNTADLHLHTQWSDGDDLDRVLECAVAAGLDAIAITDHDEIEGALEGRRRAHERRLPLVVIPGIEVSSRDGHIGALFVTRPIPRGHGAEDTVQMIHEAGGIAVAHHPYVPRWIERVLRQRLGVRDLIKTVPFDAVECSNAVPGNGVRYNLAAINALREAHVPVAVTGSSDAHIARLVGKGRTYFAGNEGPVSLRTALTYGFACGSEGYWSTREKLAYYAHLVTAVLRNAVRGRGSVN